MTHPTWPVVLTAECQAIAAAADDVGAADFEQVTNCPPWTVKELLVHVWGTIQLPPWVPTRGPAAAIADYYRRSERETPEYRQRSSAAAQRAAARFGSGPDVITALRHAADSLEGALGSVDLGQVVALPNGMVMTIGDYLGTRVVSVAIHGIDLAISLDVPWFTTPDARLLLVTTLEDLVGAPATTLGWDPDDLIRWATGRGAIPDHALAHPSLSAPLPVIS